MLRVLLISTCLSVCAPLQADILEVGDLNIIQQTGNPSDGLRYLDLSLTVGLNLVDAQNSAIAAYPNARLATSSEFDHLFEASTLRYDVNSVTLSAGFLPGAQINISSGANYNTSLLNILGLTFATGAGIWTAPENPLNRDLIVFRPTQLEATFAADPPISSVAWLFVTSANDATAVPEPSAASGVLICAAAWMAFKRRSASKTPKGLPV